MNESISFKTYLSGRQPATPPAGDDVLPVLQGGSEVKKIKWEELLTGTANFCEDTGEVNALVVNCATNFTALIKGLPFVIEVANTNNGPTTVLLNNILTKPLKKHGSDPLDPGNIIAGQLIVVAFDGVNFQLLSSTASKPDRYYTETTGSNNAYNATLNTGISSYNQLIGLSIFLKANHTNTNAATMNINDLGAVSMKKKGNKSLAPGDISENQIIICIYDGTCLQIVSHISDVPIGGEMYWPIEAPPPDGWLFEDTSSLACATYVALFSILGWGYGKPDNDHFNLPGPGGRFVRIWANGLSTDPDRASRTAPTTPGATISAGDHVGTNQADAFKSHTHQEGGNAAGGQNARLVYGMGATNGDEALNSNTLASGGAETRSINTSRALIIKAY